MLVAWNFFKEIDSSEVTDCISSNIWIAYFLARHCPESLAQNIIWQADSLLNYKCGETGANLWRFSTFSRVIEDKGTSQKVYLVKIGNISQCSCTVQ
jgi:hypothetical protein